jgi:hypothetical protein
MVMSVGNRFWELCHECSSRSCGKPAYLTLRHRASPVSRGSSLCCANLDQDGATSLRCSSVSGDTCRGKSTRSTSKRCCTNHKTCYISWPRRERRLACTDRGSFLRALSKQAKSRKEDPVSLTRCSASVLLCRSPRLARPACWGGRGIAPDPAHRLGSTGKMQPYIRS